jgi:hypothetical protein
VKVTNVSLEATLSAGGIVTVGTSMIKVRIHVGVKVKLGVARVGTEMAAIDGITRAGWFEWGVGVRRGNNRRWY